MFISVLNTFLGFKCSVLSSQRSIWLWLLRTEDHFRVDPNLLCRAHGSFSVPSVLCLWKCCFNLQPWTPLTTSQSTLSFSWCSTKRKYCSLFWMNGRMATMRNWSAKRNIRSFRWPCLKNSPVWPWCWAEACGWGNLWAPGGLSVADPSYQFILYFTPSQMVH